MLDFQPVLTRLSRFRDDESGAATVDWVVGAAAAVTLGIAVTEMVGNATVALSDTVASQIAGYEPSFDGGAGG